MFKIEYKEMIDSYVIVNEKYECLHSDGSIYYVCGEYWPTRELAQAVLDKYQPHVWEHGDIFRHGSTIMIYLYPLSGEEIRSISSRCCGNCDPKFYLKDATFLFNITEKL